MDCAQGLIYDCWMRQGTVDAGPFVPVDCKINISPVASAQHVHPFAIYLVNGPVRSVVWRQPQLVCNMGRDRGTRRTYPALPASRESGCWVFGPRFCMHGFDAQIINLPIAVEMG